MEVIMVTINLKDFYPWYTHDEYIDVSDEVAAELLADKRYEKANRRRVYRNKARYSLDAGDGIENEACHSDPSPCEVAEHGQNTCRLCRALNSLPEAQGKRIEAHYILGMSKANIARFEGVSEAAIHQSIKRGLQEMRKYMKKDN